MTAAEDGEGAPDPRRQRYLEVVSELVHDLRTPLTVIRGAATLLLQSDPSIPEARRMEMLDLIDRQAERMSDRMEDRMAMVELEAGLVVRLEPVDLAEILEQARGWASRQFPERPLDLPRLRPGLRVRADPRRLLQILRSLLTRAMGAGAGPVSVTAVQAGGGVRIEVRARGSTEAGGHVGRDRDLAPGVDVADALTRAMGGSLSVSPPAPGGIVLSATLDPA